MKHALLALPLLFASACAVARSTDNEPLAPERLRANSEIEVLGDRGMPPALILER